MSGTYGFIGLGLIGGSLAKSLKRVQPDCRIIAYTRTADATEQAKKEGVLDEAASSLTDPLFSECGMLFLCAPVSTNAKALKLMKDILSPDCLITDVGSVKTGMHKAMEELGLGSRFIGGHPMTGSEKSGYSASTDHLFENAYYILTPTESVPGEWVERYRRLVASFLAIPLILTYQEHDYITAAVSHLPHVIASSLVNTVHNLDNSEEHMKMIAAGGFKDITRIASSSPEMWEQICVDNHENISRVMDEFIRLMMEARDNMNKGNAVYIHKMFADSGEYRSTFTDRSLGSIKKVHRIYCDVVDEAGAIATIATILSVNGISIKNIGIVHNREFEEGALSIEFYTGEQADRAAAVLRQHRYRVWET